MKAIKLLFLSFFLMRLNSYCLADEKINLNKVDNHFDIVEYNLNKLHNAAQPIIYLPLEIVKESIAEKIVQATAEKCHIHTIDKANKILSSYHKDNHNKNHQYFKEVVFLVDADNHKKQNAPDFLIYSNEGKNLCLVRYTPQDDNKPEVQ